MWFQLIELPLEDKEEPSSRQFMTVIDIENIFARGVKNCPLTVTDNCIFIIIIIIIFIHIT
jgi:hypothetical protein